jgi:hypothetical protein
MAPTTGTFGLNDVIANRTDILAPEYREAYKQKTEQEAKQEVEQINPRH